jgi:hypothetical protein
MLGFIILILDDPVFGLDIIASTVFFRLIPAYASGNQAPEDQDNEEWHPDVPEFDQQHQNKSGELKEKSDQQENDRKNDDRNEEIILHLLTFSADDHSLPA